MKGGEIPEIKGTRLNYMNFVLDIGVLYVYNIIRWFVILFRHTLYPDGSSSTWVIEQVVICFPRNWAANLHLSTYTSISVTLCSKDIDFTLAGS